MDLAKDLTSFSSGQRSRLWRKRLLLAFLCVAVLAAAAAGYRYVERPVAVTATHVRQGPVAEVVYATGFVEPVAPVDVSSRVTAPVLSVLVDEGDRVSRGQALAVLDAEDQREIIAQLRASRINAEQDERRSLALFRRGWSTNESRDKAVAATNSARALEAAGRARLNQYTIRSGITGVVLRRDVEPGDLASSARTLFEIGDLNQLRVTATVDERDIVLVHPGARAMMSTEALPGRVLRGTVSEITPGGDPDQRAFRVRIQPDESTLLPVGLTVEVNILARERDQARLVPASAVKDNMILLAEDGRVRRLPVEIGIRGSKGTEIRTELPKNACVIVDPPAGLKDGQRVRPKGC